MQLPVVKDGKPLVINDLPAVAEDPCDCCEDLPIICSGCQQGKAPAVVTVTISNLNLNSFNHLNGSYICNALGSTSCGWQVFGNTPSNCATSFSSDWNLEVGIVLNTTILVEFRSSIHSDSIPGSSPEFNFNNMYCFVWSLNLGQKPDCTSSYNVPLITAGIFDSGPGICNANGMALKCDIEAELVFPFGWNATFGTIDSPTCQVTF